MNKADIILKDLNMISNNIRSALFDAYEQGRVDAIEEFAELLLKHKSKDDYPIMCFDEFTVKRFAEQLKEQKNE